MGFNSAFKGLNTPRIPLSKSASIHQS